MQMGPFLKTTVALQNKNTRLDSCIFFARNTQEFIIYCHPIYNNQLCSDLSDSQVKDLNQTFLKVQYLPNNIFF